MASMGAGHLETDQSIRVMKTHLNKTLQAILKAEGLPSAGVKAELQSRIADSKSLA
jgi:hypothetical protein